MSNQEQSVTMDVEENDELEEPAIIHGRETAERSIRQQVFVDHFPVATAGAPVRQRTNPSASSHSTPDGCPYAPFQSQMDWEIARWAKLRGPGSTAVSELFGIPGVRYCPPHMSLGCSNSLPASRCTTSIIQELTGVKCNH